MRKLLLLLFTLGVHISSLSGPIPTVELLWVGKAVPYYGNSGDERQLKIMELLRQGQLAERMASVARDFRLRQDIGVGIVACGKPSAFFSPDHKSIVICTEFVDLVIQEVKSDARLAEFSERQMIGWVSGVVWGVYFHELAHALININRILITGREEDVADQFSTWFALNYIDLTKQPILSPMVWFWSSLAKKRDVGGMSRDALQLVMANEHGLDMQRTYNVACWGLGANPESMSRTVKMIGLPASRAERCPSEYAMLDAAMRSNFSKFIKAKPHR